MIPEQTGRGVALWCVADEMRESESEGSGLGRAGLDQMKRCRGKPQRSELWLVSDVAG